MGVSSGPELLEPVHRPRTGFLARWGNVRGNNDRGFLNTFSFFFSQRERNHGERRLRYDGESAPEGKEEGENQEEASGERQAGDTAVAPDVSQHRAAHAYIDEEEGGDKLTTLNTTAVLTAKRRRGRHSEIIPPDVAERTWG